MPEIALYLLRQQRDCYIVARYRRTATDVFDYIRPAVHKTEVPLVVPASRKQHSFLLYISGPVAEPLLYKTMRSSAGYKLRERETSKCVIFFYLDSDSVGDEEHDWAITNRGHRLGTD